MTDLLPLLLPLLLSLLAGIGIGIYLDRKWLLRRPRGSLPVPKKRSQWEWTARLIDPLSGHETWMVMTGLDREQHFLFARHILHAPGRGAAKLNYAALTPASSKVMSRGQLARLRPVLVAQKMADCNPRTGTLAPLPLLGEWAHLVDGIATRTERKEYVERRKG